MNKKKIIDFEEIRRCDEAVTDLAMAIIEFEDENGDENDLSIADLPRVKALIYSIFREKKS